MSVCRVCASALRSDHLFLGEFSISSRYRNSYTETNLVYPFSIGQCLSCATVQLDTSVSSEEFIPRFEWIAYLEPEDHLNDLVTAILSIPGIDQNSHVIGLSEKDASMLDLLNDKGIKNTRIINLSELGISHARAGVESIQKKFTTKAAETLKRTIGKIDVIIARHVFEHAQNPIEFLEALRMLSDNSAYIVLEVPDYSKSFRNCDYSTLWEEHTLYLTPTTLNNILIVSGFISLDQFSFEYSHENCLVNIFISNTELINRSPSPMSNSLRDELSAFRKYIDEYYNLKDQFNKYISRLISMNKKIAFYGAGHVSIMFIQLMGLSTSLNAIVDDNTCMLGMYLPGADLEILPSSFLLTNGIDICFVAASEESEIKIIRNNQEFIDNGGSFLSIFSTSKYSYRKVMI